MDDSDTSKTPAYIPLASVQTVDSQPLVAEAGRSGI